jgi:hypothetical protein
MSAPVSPTFVNSSAIFAFCENTRMSLASASTAPAPAAMPFTAAMIGLPRRNMLRTTAPVMRVNASVPSSSLSISGPMISSTLPPLQKPRP